MPRRAFRIGPPIATMNYVRAGRRHRRCTVKRIRIQRRVTKGLLVVWMIGAMSTAAAAYPIMESSRAKASKSQGSVCTIHPQIRHADPGLCRTAIQQPIISDVEYRGIDAPSPAPVGGFELEWWMVVLSAALVVGAAIVSVRLYPGHSGRELV